MAIETGKYVKRFAFWNPATWAIPKLYWDAFSQEQRIHAICRQLEKVIRYADYVGVNVDDIAQRLQDIEDGKLDDIIVAAVEAWFEEHASDITQRITALESELGDGFTEENTVTDAVANLNTAIDGISDVLPLSEFSAENTVKDALDAQAKTISKVEREATLSKYVKDYIVAAYPVYRYEYERTYVGGAQGSTVFEVGNALYYAVGIIKGNGTTDSTMRIMIVNLADGSTASTVDLSGHANCITYRDEKLYISGNAQVDNAYIQIIDVHDPLNPVVDTPKSLAAFAERNSIAHVNWYSATKIKSGFYLCDWTTGNVWQVDDDIENETIVCTLELRDTKESVTQCIIYNEPFDIVGAVFHDRVEWFTMDGKQLRTTHFEEIYAFCQVSEIESITLLENGDFYFSNNYIAANTPQYDGWYITTLFKTNMASMFAPSATKTIKSGNNLGILIDPTADLIPTLHGAYVGYTPAVKIQTPADVMAIMQTFQTDSCWIELRGDIDSPLILTGIHASINFGNHMFPGAFFVGCEIFAYDYEACYEDEDETPIFIDNSAPVLMYSRFTRLICKGKDNKVGSKYLLSSGAGIVVVPQASVDAHVCYLSNSTVHLTPTWAS